MIKIPRFEVVDVGRKGSYHKGILDHVDDRIVVLVKEILDEQTTVSVAEGIISVIENTILGEEQDDP